ncbi:endonuclease domain-containing protein [Micromonospora sp. NBRC 110038]|uniref:endonuclease domain-containing protein n=1 Tax=Micromonospora sp. NBRC 110038 TaxID=1550034 RepID=UPI001E2D65E6|nr:DUF559 domain-containing protein [Micromonospora sp. NBRC 110038]
MDEPLRALLDRHDGLLTRTLATQVVPAWVLRHAVDTGDLLRVLPGVYVESCRTRPCRAGLAAPAPGSAEVAVLPPGSAGLAAPLSGSAGLAVLPPELRHRAAVAYAQGRGALGGPTALHIWGVRRQPEDEAVHLDVPARSGLRTRPPHLVLHHRHGFRPEPPQAVTRRGLPLVPLERALVDAWPLLPVVDRPAPLIRAVNDGLTTPARVGEALAQAPRLARRAELRVLLDRLSAGCRSPLEVWGHDHVFTGAQMPQLRRQFRVRIEGRTMYLDVYAERERVDFELDGATAHGDPRQREIDLRRDALLATRGILVVRFAHRRLVREPDRVRAEVLAILASRQPPAASRQPPTANRTDGLTGRAQKEAGRSAVSRAGSAGCGPGGPGRRG